MGRKPMHHVPKDTGLNYANTQAKHTPLNIYPSSVFSTTKPPEPQPTRTGTWFPHQNTSEPTATLDTIHQDLQQILAALGQIRERVK